MNKDEKQELKLKIEELKFRLKKYINDGKDKSEIYELSRQIDELIVKFHGCE